jgi:alpha-tubulin suppressor-like RCC1 family protein
MNKHFFLFLINIFLVCKANAQVPSDVPLNLTSPLVGQLSIQKPPNCCTYLGNTFWAFWQHQGGGHTVNGGIGGANDFYAFDCNLSNNLDDGKNVYPVEDGYVSHLSGWSGSSYGQLLIRHVTNGVTWYSGYLHMDNITTKKATNGAFISKNEMIGTISNVSPSAISSHLHFAVYYRNANLQLVSVDRTFIERQPCNPPIPQLTAPNDNQSNVNLPVNFSWNAVNNADAYRINISTSTVGFDPLATPMFPNAIINQSGNSSFTTYSWNSALPNTTYYWVVRSNVPGCGSQVSTIRSFTTSPGCTGGVQYPNTILSPTGSWQTQGNIYAGEYSVFNVTNGETYIWSLCPADGGNSSYDSEITLLNHSNGSYIAYNDDYCGTNSYLQWTSTFTGQVRALLNQYNCQTNSISTTLAYKQLCNLPSQPGSISGFMAVCQGTSQTYSISPVAGATSYTWLLPSGWTGSSTGTSITCTAGSQSGNVSVRANNSCGSSSYTNLGVTVSNLPSQPGSISGFMAVCQGASQTYSISPVAGATSYTWLLPSGWTGSSTGTSITCTVGSQSGNVSVRANNSCGSSSYTNLGVTVSNLPSQPGSISGFMAVCQGASQTYSISPVAGATSYTWLLPSGWTGSSTGTSITCTVGSQSGNVSVRANNSCGSSAYSNSFVSVQNLPNASFSNNISNLTVTFSNSSTNATSYSWNFGNGQTSTQTNPVVTYSLPGTYNVCLTATNTCGSVQTCQSITVSNCTNPTANFTYNINGLTATFTNTSANATSYSWNFGNGQTSTQTNPTATYSTPGTYNVCLTATNACGSVQTCQTVTILNNQGTAGCWKMVSAGLYHAAAIKEDGTLWSWGRNVNGELGDGTNLIKNYPVQTSLSNDWKEVQCGGFHTIALKNNGTLWAWGRNDYGQLGIGNTINSNIPIQIGSDSNWAELGAGSYTNGAIKKDGTLWMWGNNANNEIGDGTTINKLVPVQIGIDKNWNTISKKGSTQKHAIKTDGTLWGWGLNLFGELGNNTLSNAPTPIKIGIDSTWLEVQSSSSFSAGIKSNLKVYTWGDNQYGQLGLGNNVNQLLPTEITNLNSINKLALGKDHNMVLQSSGLMYAWGKNDVGQLGNGNTINSNVSTSLPSALFGWRQGMGGYSFSIALDGGDIYTWGNNNFGQLGDSTYVNKTMPTKIASNCSCPLPEVKFAYIQDSLQFEFINLSQDATNYNWAFGNGQTTNVNNLTTQLNTYAAPGSYQVCLSASNQCGSRQYCKQVNIDSINCNLALSSYALVSPTCTPGCDGSASVTYSANYSYAIAPSGAMISSTGSASGLCAATVYTITATSASGCTGTTTVQLAAPPPPVVTITSNPVNATICAGASMTLTASGASSYNWSPSISNGVAFTPLTTTTYTVTGQDATTNCVSSATKTVIVNAAPTISITSIPTVASVCNGSPVTLTASGANTYTWSGGITNGTSFVPSSTTTFTVTGVNANGCTKTATRMVIVMNSSTSLAITSNPANAAVCAGVPVTLTATGDSMITWSGGIFNNVPFTPTATTTYTVTGTSGNGCTATATKTVTVNPLPVITINPSPNDTICQGAAISLTASGGASYNWSGGIQQSLPFTPSTSSIYTVTATSAAGCNKTATQSVVVTSPCGSCLPSVIIQGNPFTTALTESGGWIQNSSVVLIPSGANVKLDAHANSFVQLNPGFQTITGAVFLARPFNGCTAGAPSIAILDTSSATKSESIPELITTNEYLVVYPNPTSGRIKVAFNQKVDEIRLYDQFGKLLQKHIPLSDAETELDLSPYSNGMYYLRANGFIPVKVIKH